MLLSEQAYKKIDRELAKFPADQRQSAVMAALAVQATRRIRVATGVTSLATRHPIVVAMEAADADAEHCARMLRASVVHVEPAPTEAAMRELRYAATAGLGARATGHTASDQAETVLYRIVSSGSTRGIKARREDGVVRPLLGGVQRPLQERLVLVRARLLQQVLDGQHQRLAQRGMRRHGGTATW